MESLSALGKFLIYAGLISSMLGLALASLPRLASFGKISSGLLIRNDQLFLYSPVLMAVVLAAILTLLINFVVRH